MEKEINLKNLFAVIRRRLWISIVLTIITTSVGAAYSIYFKTPLYASSARILIQTNNDVMNTFTVMINEPAVMEKVAAELNINRSASALSGQISAESIQGSQIVRITVVDKDSELAAKIANTTAAVYKQAAASILKFNDVSILSEAKAMKHSVPININHTKTIMIAFFVGLVLSIGFIFLLDSLDDKIKSERTIEKLLDIPTLGSISKMNKKNVVDKQRKREPVSLRGRDNWFTKVEEKETKSRKKA